MLRGEGNGRNPPRGSPAMRGVLLDKIRRMVPDEGLPNLRRVTSPALAEEIAVRSTAGEDARHGTLPRLPWTHCSFRLTVETRCVVLAA